MSTESEYTFSKEDLQMVNIANHQANANQKKLSPHMCQNGY